MTGYLLQRLLLLILTLFGICLLSFVIASLSPGDPAVALSGATMGSRGKGRATDEVLKHTRRVLYLDRPRLVNLKPETRVRFVQAKLHDLAWSDNEFTRQDVRGELLGEIGTSALDQAVAGLEPTLARAEAETKRRRDARAELEKAAAAPEGPLLEAAIAGLTKVYDPRGPRYSRAATPRDRAKGWLEWSASRTEEPLDAPRRLLELLPRIVTPEDGGPLPPLPVEQLEAASLAQRVKTWGEWWRGNAQRYTPEAGAEAARRWLDAPGGGPTEPALVELTKVGSVAAPTLFRALADGGERTRRAAFGLSVVVHKSWDMTPRADTREALRKDWETKRRAIDEAKDLEPAVRAAREKELGDAQAFVEAKLVEESSRHLTRWREWWFRAEESYVDFSTPRQLVRAFTQTQFGNWMSRLFRGLDFGESYFWHRPVSTLIVERLKVTLELNAWALLLTYLIAIPIGIYSATHPRTLADTVTTVVLFLLYSLPSFWLGAILILLFTGPPIGWDLFPSHGLESLDAWKLGTFARWKDHALHLVLPVACLTYHEVAYISRQMRGGMLEVIRQDYIRTARAKGLSERIVVYKHALRNSLIPTITILAYILPGMFGGSVIIESMFSIDGIGRLMFQAIQQKDIPVVMADVFIGGVLTLLGILVADLSYALVDPRIQLQ